MAINYKVVSEDFDNLNQALRILAASIEDHINNLTQGKKPEEVLEFFEKYEEKIVVGSYHRFKTNDNLFYYRTSLYESLDKCEDDLFDALVMDYMDAEHVDKVEASAKIKDLYEDDDTLCHDVFQVFGQNYFDSSSLATPVKKRRFY